MRDLVDGQKEVLVGGRADNVAQRPEPPRPKRRVSQNIGAGELQGDNKGDNIFGQWLGAAKLRDLNVGKKSSQHVCPVKL